MRLSDALDWTARRETVFEVVHAQRSVRHDDNRTGAARECFGVPRGRTVAVRTGFVATGRGVWSLREPRRLQLSRPRSRNCAGAIARGSGSQLSDTEAKSEGAAHHCETRTGAEKQTIPTPDDPRSILTALTERLRQRRGGRQREGQRQRRRAPRFGRLEPPTTNDLNPAKSRSSGSEAPEAMFKHEWGGGGGWGAIFNAIVLLQGRSQFAAFLTNDCLHVFPAAISSIGGRSRARPHRALIRDKFAPALRALSSGYRQGVYDLPKRPSGAVCDNSLREQPLTRTVFRFWPFLETDSAVCERS